ncbi:hypothetical protein GCM10022140_47880 [Rhodococcus aetherivorans]
MDRWKHRESYVFPKGCRGRRGHTSAVVLGKFPEHLLSRLCESEVPASAEFLKFVDSDHAHA